MNLEPVTFTNAYRGPAKGSHYEQWREEVCRGFLNIDIGPCKDGIVDMHGQFARLSPVGIAISTGSSAVIGRTPNTNRDGDDDLALVCHTQGTMAYAHRNEFMMVGPSAVCLSETAQPSAAVLNECRGFTALKINRISLLNLCPNAEDLLFKPIATDIALSGMIGRYAALAVSSAPQLSEHAQSVMGQHLLDLVSLALGASPDKAEISTRRGQSGALLALMKADIIANIGRRRVSIEFVAKRYGLSARQAQRLFEQEETTFTGFLLEERLRFALQMLQNPVHRWRKIGDIAHSAGFSDLSYFNRRFRQRFGFTPSDSRNP